MLHGNSFNNDNSAGSALGGGVASNNTPICEGSTINLLATNATGGTPGYTYSWTGPGGFSSTIQNPSIPSAPAAATGAYTLIVTDANLCTKSSVTNVTVNSNPMPSISGSTSFCPG